MNLRHAAALWWPVALFVVVVGVGFLIMASRRSDVLRDRDPAFFSLKGAACGRFLTADEKLEWERINEFEKASARQMANLSCQQLAAILDTIGTKEQPAERDCFSQMNSLENDVWSTLSWHSTSALSRRERGKSRLLRTRQADANCSPGWNCQPVDT
jgi:hypothetical protein